MLLNFQILDLQVPDQKGSFQPVAFFLIKDNFVPGPGNYQ